jgi:hypothetical protein
MASFTLKQPCSKCDKGAGITICGGCEEWFCGKHFTEHRNELATRMDQIEHEHNLLQQDLKQDNCSHPLLSRINEWEEESLRKIRETADLARQNLRMYLSQTKTQLKTSLDLLTNELKSSHISEDYTEIDFKEWNEQLKELRQTLEKPSTIEIISDDQPIPIIHVNHRSGMSNNEQMLVFFGGK